CPPSPPPQLVLLTLLLPVQNPAEQKSRLGITGGHCWERRRWYPLGRPADLVPSAAAENRWLSTLRPARAPKYRPKKHHRWALQRRAWLAQPAMHSRYPSCLAHP